MLCFSAKIAVLLKAGDRIKFNFAYDNEEMPELQKKRNIFDVKSTNQLFEEICNSFVSFGYDEDEDEDIEVGLDSAFEEYEELYCCDFEGDESLDCFKKNLKAHKLDDIEKVFLGVAALHVPEDGVALEWVKYDFVNKTVESDKERVECFSREDYDIDKIVNRVFN